MNDFFSITWGQLPRLLEDIVESLPDFDGFWIGIFSSLSKTDYLFF